MSSRRLPPPLLALSPGDLSPSICDGFLARVAACARAGLRGVLLREPDLRDRDFLALARGLRAALDPASHGWLCLHDRAHLARACLADGVHLGGRSLAPGEVRGWLDERLTLGLSTHAGDEPSAWKGADYLVHGPVFEVPGKGPAIGLAGLAAAVERSGSPVWALGGVGPAQVAQVLGAGAQGVAVLRGVFGAADPLEATADYLRALGGRIGPGL